MQLAASDALDLSKESKATLAMYGIGTAADRFLRPALSDRSPAGGARRPLRAAVHQRPNLGQPHEPGRRVEDGLRPHRSADRRAADGPEAARASRRDAGRLGRRVRPSADRAVAGGQGRAQGGARSQQECLLHLDGRRRHQGRHHLRSDRRTRPGRRRGPRERARLARDTSASSGTASRRASSSSRTG